MKKIVLLFFITVILLSCHHSAEVNRRDSLEAGRGFIESSLKGDYDEAQKYVLEDSTNMEYFNGFKNFNENQNDAEKQGYRDANIIIDSTQKISDSVTIIIYSNTYKNKPSKLKMVKKNNQWMVDFKYTFNSNL